MTQYSQLRLEIAEYFESVIRDVDLIVETKIARDAEFEVVLNERRERQIVGIQQMMKDGLAKVESIRKESGQEVLTTMKQLLDECCFVVEFGELPFVIKANRYIEASEIEHFKTFMKWHTLSHLQRLNALTGRRRIFQCDVYGVDAEPIEEEVCQRFQYADDDLFLDFSSWFAKGQEITLVTIVDIYQVQEEISEDIKSPFNIKTIELDCEPARGFLQSESAIKSFCSIFEGAQQIIISLGYCSLEYVASMQHIKAIDHRIELRADNCGFSLDYEQSDDELSEDELRLRQDVYSLSFSADELHHKTCLNGFVNLREVRLFPNKDSSQDWSILDPVKTSLSDFSVNGFTSLSYKMFSGMRSLKHLILEYSRLRKVELDENGQLFADLTQLEYLSLDLNTPTLTSGCLIELPLLKKLKIIVHRSDELFDASQINLRFNLPELSELDISYVGELSSTVVSSIIKSLPSVETLHIIAPTDEEISSAVKSLKKLNKLILHRFEHDFSRDMFVGMENLRHLEISIEDDSNDDILVDSLQHLTNLEELRLSSDGKKTNKMNIDGLINLKRIYYDYDGTSLTLEREQFVLSGLNKLVYQIN